MRRQIIVQTFWSYGEASKNAVRVRPLADQGFSTDLRVSFSVELRNSRPVGTLFKAWVVEADYQGTPFLKSHVSWPCEVVTSKGADAFIKSSVEGDGQRRGAELEPLELKGASQHQQGWPVPPALPVRQ